MLFFLLKCFSLFLNCLFVSGKGGEGGELCRTVEHRHLWMLGGYMMRMIYYFVVIHNCCFFCGTSRTTWTFRTTRTTRTSRTTWTFRTTRTSRTFRTTRTSRSSCGTLGMLYYLEVYSFLIHSWCPPICSFLSFAVAPSSKSRALRMVFLPNDFFIFITASCMRRSFARSLSSFSRSRRRAS